MLLQKDFAKFHLRQPSLATANSTETTSSSGSGGRSSKILQNDELLFHGATIKKTWADKRNEAKIQSDRKRSQLIQEASQMPSFLLAATSAPAQTKRPSEQIAPAH